MDALRSGLWQRGLILLAVAALTGALAMGCDRLPGRGGDDGGALKIAFLADFSGPLAEFGPAIQTGVDLAIEHINAAGGVNGQPVTLVTGDTRVDPTIAVEEARRVIEIEGVHAIVGPLGSSETLAVAESISGASRIPTISPSATSPALAAANDNGFLFRTTVSDAAQGVVLARLAEEQGLTNVAAIHLNDAYGLGLAEAFRDAFSGTVTLAPYEPGQATFLSELQQAAREGADVLIAIGYPTEAQVFLREAIENGIFNTFIFVDGTKSEDLIGAIGADRLEGMRGTAPGAGPETDATRAFNAAYEEKYGSLPTLPFIREAYDATVAIALAAEKAKSTDGTAIRDALRQVAAPPGELVIPGADGVRQALEAIRAGRDVDYEGAATSVNWNEVGDVATGYIEIWEYRGGQIVEVESVPFDLS